MRAILFGLAVGLAALPAPSAFAQGGPVVVELFTSQSCSSCPPADAFLTDLARTRPDVLPLAFHVTYWNRLDWKDPYSFDAATERQQGYARSLGDHQVYTPEMVVNGVSGLVGSNRAQGLEAISRAASDPTSRVALELARAGQELRVKIPAGSGRADVLLVGFDAQHRTPVGRGENGGRTLLESNIVRSLTVAGNWTGTALALRAPLPAGEQFAVLLQAPDGHILGAARLRDTVS